MPFHRLAALLGVFTLLASCGEESSDDVSGREFSQDLRQIHYSLKGVDFEIEITYPSGKREVLKKTLEFQQGDSKDKIQRILEKGAFVLKANDELAPYTISSKGDIQHERNTRERVGACELKGSSRVGGSAGHLELNMDWSLEAELSGEGCDAGIRAKFLEFQNQEVESLHLQGVKDLLTSSDQARDGAQRIRMTLKVTGETV